MSSATKPVRLGFLGVGWIGLARMKAVLESGLAEVVAIADPSPELQKKALELAPGAKVESSLAGLLELSLDGLVIATPSALHAEQSIAALERGISVFCQKPLARSAAETKLVVEAARRADRRLEVDFSYRYTRGLEAVKALLDSGELGPIYSARFVFHNAYGPDKPWYFDRALSGGGALIDLGIHLVDSALWLLDRPRITRVTSALFAKGKRLARGSAEVEDYAVAQLESAQGAAIELACSWNLPAGADAVISAELYGPHGGVSFHNVGGSFYDFAVERLRGRNREPLVSPPDEWGGRAIVAYAERLGRAPGHDPRSEELVEVATLLDSIYAGSI